MAKTDTKSKPRKAAGRRIAASKTRPDGASEVNVPKDGSPGNCKLDQRWVLENEGNLRIIEDDEEVPFGVRLRWDGTAEDLGSAFVIPDNEHMCIGEAYVRDNDGRRIIDRDGMVLVRPCTRWRMKGSLVCPAHGGLTDGGLAIARRRLAMAADSVVGKLIAIALRPGTLDADAIRAINSILDRAGIRGGVDVAVDTPEWRRMLKDMWEGGAAFGGDSEPERALEDSGGGARVRSGRPDRAA